MQVLLELFLLMISFGSEFLGWLAMESCAALVVVFFRWVWMAFAFLFFVTAYAVLLVIHIPYYAYRYCTTPRRTPTHQPPPPMAYYPAMDDFPVVEYRYNGPLRWEHSAPVQLTFAAPPMSPAQQWARYYANKQDLDAFKAYIHGDGPRPSTRVLAPPTPTPTYAPQQPVYFAAAPQHTGLYDRTSAVQYLRDAAHQIVLALANIELAITDPSADWDFSSSALVDACVALDQQALRPVFSRLEHLSWKSTDKKRLREELAWPFDDLKIVHEKIEDVELEVEDGVPSSVKALMLTLESVYELVGLNL